MQLQYRKYGNGPARLVILHGLLGSSQNWHSAAKKVSEQYGVVVPDLRNHGDSPHGEHSIELMSQDILELFEREQIATAILMGHSMGGWAAMWFALNHSERLRGLIVVDMAPLAQMGDLQNIFKALRHLDLSQLRSREEADRKLSESGIKSPVVRQFLLQNLKRDENGNFIWRCNLPELHRFIETPRQFKIGNNQTYDGPALFIAGGRSEYRIWEKEDVIKKHFPAAQIAVVREAGHWVHFENLDEFVDLVRNFMAAHINK